MDTKAIAKLLAEASKEEVTEIIKELKETYGFQEPEPVVVEVDSTQSSTNEKTLFNVVLQSAGGEKLKVIKTLNSFLNLGLTATKGVVDTAPVTIKENVTKELAQEMKAALEENGAEVLIV